MPETADCQRLQDLILVANLAIGDEHDHPLPAASDPGQQTGSLLQTAVSHLGTATRQPKPGQMFNGHGTDCDRSPETRTIQANRAVVSTTMVEGQHREPIIGRERVPRSERRHGRAATIFQPSILPDRSSTNTTSRGRSGMARSRRQHGTGRTCHRNRQATTESELATESSAAEAATEALKVPDFTPVPHRKP